MKKILVVAPHPDDIEFGCAGTLLNFKKLGYIIEIIITVRPSREINIKRDQSIVESELRESMKLLGFNYQLFKTPLTPTARPSLLWDNDTITAIEGMLQYQHYDLVITSDDGDYHQDHHNTFNIVNSICRGGITNELWTMEIPPYSHRNTSFNPTVFIDISSTFELKLQSIRCYDSYVTRELILSIEGLARYRSQLLKESSYAEAFKQVFKLGK